MTQLSFLVNDSLRSVRLKRITLVFFDPVRVWLKLVAGFFVFGLLRILPYVFALRAFGFSVLLFLCV